jgi:hypothetical protein
MLNNIPGLFTDKRRFSFNPLRWINSKRRLFDGFPALTVLISIRRAMPVNAGLNDSISLELGRIILTARQVGVQILPNFNPQPK